MPTDDDRPVRPTKAAIEDLTAERDVALRKLARTEADLRAARQEVADWRAAKIADPEAEALSGCVRAIEALLSSLSASRTNMGYVSSPYSNEAAGPESTPVGRILLHLGARYGVPIARAEPPDPNLDEPVVVSVPRRIGELLREQGHVY